MKKLHYNSVFWFYLAMLLLVFLGGGFQSSWSCSFPYQTPKAPAARPSNTSLLLLTSAESPGKDGWILFFDKNSLQGKLYEPPGMLLSAAVHRDGSTSRFSFETDKCSKLPYHYTFDGISQSNRIEGTLRRRDNDTRHSALEHTVRGDLQEGSALEAIKRYSNVEFIQASGDLIGAELLILDERKGAGFLTFFESYWNEPILVTLPLTKSNWKTSKKLGFELILEDGFGTYEAVFSRGRVTIRRTDDVAMPTDRGVTLPQRGGLADCGTR